MLKKGNFLHRCCRCCRCRCCCCLGEDVVVSLSVAVGVGGHIDLHHDMVDNIICCVCVLYYLYDIYHGKKVKTNLSRPRGYACWLRILLVLYSY